MTVKDDNSNAARFDFAPEWGADTLSEFIDKAFHNIAATSVNLPAEYGALRKIHDIFLKITDNLHQSPEIISGFMLFRTHSSFLAACRLCLSGQLPETFMVLRSCLESALYGLYVHGDNARQLVWLLRHDNDAAMKEMKQQFTVRKVMDHLGVLDAKTQDIAQKLYDRTIDYGGHPNEKAVFTQMGTHRENTRINFRHDHFVCGAPFLNGCLKTTAQVGICSLDVFYYVFRDRYRILGMDAELNEIRRGF